MIGSNENAESVFYIMLVHFILERWENGRHLFFDFPSLQRGGTCFSIF